MDEAKIQTIFSAQTLNVRALRAARTRLKRALNDNLRDDDSESLSLNTRFYALLYSAWAEADFRRLVFTPRGLPPQDVVSICEAAKKSIQDGWLACLHAALPRVHDPLRPDLNDAAEARLRTLVTANIVGPYQLRNKLAHGQWVKAMNSGFTDVNAETSARVESLDYVEVDRWFVIQERVSHILEMLIASPQNAFTARYWTLIDAVDRDIDKMRLWTLMARKARLKTRR